MRTLSLLAVSITLCGCAATVGGDSTGRFVTNGQRTALGPAATAELATFWKNDPRAVFGDKHIGSRDPLWVMSFIARTESQGVSPCRSLRAVELRRLDLSPFTGTAAYNEKRVTYSPREYNEIWVVEACGVVREWRVLDDPTDPANPLTVLLLRRRT